MIYRSIVATMSLLAITMFCPAQQPTLSQTDPELRARIKELIVVLNLEQNSMKMLDQLLANLKGVNPKVSDEFLEKFKKEVDMNEFKETVVEVWAKYYTLEDINGLLAFYRSPLGKKMIETQPKLQHDLMIAGSAWGKKLGQRIEAELKKEQTSNNEPQKKP
jgi:uncharacterized protein